MSKFASQFSLSSLLSLAVWFLISSPCASQIVIRKTAQDQNPPLQVASFNGPKALESQLRGTLQRCNWFQLVNQPTTDGYTLHANYAPGNPATIEFRIGRGGGQLAAFRQTLPTNGENRAIYAAVDRIIETVFSNPGPCLSQIAFALASNGTKEIFTSNFDGSQIRRLTHNRSISTEPAWSADGRQLVYTLYRGARTQIVQVEPALGRQRRITSFAGLNSSPALSPDGRRLALTLSVDKQVDLYLMNLADGALTRLTRDNAVESSPAWSPDGRQIVYVSDRAGGRPQLFLISSSGGNPQRLLADLDEAVSPDWSPVSNKICYATRQGRQYVIAVVDMSTDERVKEIITTGAGDFESPSWAPDGRHIVCSQTGPGGSQLIMADSWTVRMIPITQPGAVSLPAWSRMP